MSVVFIQGSGGKREEEKTVALAMADGDQTVTPSDGKVLSKVTIEKPDTLVPENIKEGVVIAGVTGTQSSTPTAPSDLDGLVDGSITDFVMPAGKTVIAPYRFYEFKALKSINLGAVKEIGQYAFYGCSNVNNIVELPATITKIGRSAMSAFGAAKTPFQFHPAESCTVAEHGLAGSKLSKIMGKLSLESNAMSGCFSLTEIDVELTHVGTGVFANCQNLTTIKMKVNGNIEANAFAYLYRVNTVEISLDSVITFLGDRCFSGLGGSRVNPETNIIVFDFSKSMFTVIPQYAFGNSSSSTSYKNHYMKITFPASVADISSYAFMYSDNCEFYFKGETPPTLSSTNCWQNATNYKIFVPFGGINAYRSATNWNAQAAYVKGYAPAGTFSVGDTLPELNAEGYELTWYSDKACTTQVTTVTDEIAEYYCTAGTEKLGYSIQSVITLDCEISIVDSNGKSYVAGEGVRTGTALTITGTPTTAGYVPYMFKVNGADFESGSSITVSGAISVNAIYYDGINSPIKPTFADNEWIIIFSAFRAGMASQFWNVGDTKPFTSKSGKNYTLRIADMTAGRYNLADGSGTTNGVLEFVELYNLNGTTSWAINKTGKEGCSTGGGYALSDMANIYLNQIFDDLPDDLQAAISEITLNEYSYTSPSPRSGNHKLFLPAETEMLDARQSSAEGNQAGCPKYAQFEYYAENNTGAARVKKDIGGTSSQKYWLRSPVSGSNNRSILMDQGGYRSVDYAFNNHCVAPCIAI